MFSPFPPEVVELRHVRVHVVDVVRVGRVLVVPPLVGGGDLLVEQGVLGLALVVNRVKADHIPVLGSLYQLLTNFI